MSQSSCEFIYFRIKPSVNPEDPSNEEGEALLNVFRLTKHQSGHQSSAWGRASEDKNMIVWVLEWSDSRCSADNTLLDPFLPDDSLPPVSIYVTLSPPISATETLTKNPVTELCTLPYASTLSVLEAKQVTANLLSFRTALVEQLSPTVGPCSWAMGQLDRPGKLDHVNSPSGKATVHFMAVGWDSVDAHVKAKQTDMFVESIAPLREKMLSPIPGLEMKHVSFQKV